MAEKADKKKAPPAEGEGEAKAKKAPIWTKLPVLLGGVMLIEAIGMVAVFKIMGGGTPKSATAAVELQTGEEKAPEGESKEAAPAHEGAAPAEEGEKKEGGGHEGAAAKPAGPALKKGTIVETEVTSFRAPNVQTGKRYLYDVAIFASVKTENKEELEGILKLRKAAIEDRIRTIIAQSEPDKLGGGTEPGLETLRRQIKYQIEEIARPGLIEAILIPRCIPFRGD